MEGKTKMRRIPKHDQREKCERCGENPREAGRVPWCTKCVSAIESGPPELSDDYDRDYHRLYMRQVRTGNGPARIKWSIVSEGVRMIVTLRRRDGRVIVCGGHRGMDAGKRLVFGVLGASREGFVERMMGGGSGRRKQTMFRVEASVVSQDEFVKIMGRLTGT